MKYPILILAFTFSLLSYAQTNIFERYLNDIEKTDDVTKINISGTLFRFLNTIEASEKDEQEVLNILKTITNFSMITITDDKIKSDALYKLRKLNKNGYETLMTIEEKDSDIRFIIKEKNDIVSELVMIVDEKHEAVIMSITGEIDIDKLSSLSGVGVGPLKELERLKK